MKDFEAHVTRQAAFSRATFGPGPRTNGVLDHLLKEIEEVRSAPTDRKRRDEWVDLVILSLDGLIRQTAKMYPGLRYDSVARKVVQAIIAKQGENETRDWPDWRTSDPNKAIEHVRPRFARRPLSDAAKPAHKRPGWPIHRATDMHPQPEEVEEFDAPKKKRGKKVGRVTCGECGADLAAPGAECWSCADEGDFL